VKTAAKAAIRAIGALSARRGGSRHSVRDSTFARSRRSSPSDTPDYLPSGWRDTATAIVSVLFDTSSEGLPVDVQGCVCRVGTEQSFDENTYCDPQKLPQASKPVEIQRQEHGKPTARRSSGSGCIPIVAMQPTDIDSARATSPSHGRSCESAACSTPLALYGTHGRTMVAYSFEAQRGGWPKQGPGTPDPPVRCTTVASGTGPTPMVAVCPLARAEAHADWRR
jgi:hypothetical protein